MSNRALLLSPHQDHATRSCDNDRIQSADLRLRKLPVVENREDHEGLQA
jgi:hypothetical protein